MGGYGSLILSMRHPDLFSACAAFSSSIRTKEQMINMEQGVYDGWQGKIFGVGLTGEERITQHWLEHSILEIVQTAPVETLSQVRYYIDCGDHDYLTEGNTLLHLYMVRRAISHEYRVRDRGHEWEYWRTALPSGLAFISSGFRR